MRVAHRLPRRDHERGARDPGEFGASRDVVIVDVGLDNVSQLRAPVGEHGEHAIDVPLRVDDDCPRAGEDDVAPVAQLRGFDRGDVRGHPRTIPHARANGPS